MRSTDSRVRPRWTLEDVDDVQAVLASKKQRSPTGKRLHQIGNKRAAARQAGDPIVLWDTAYEITKLTGLLESLEIDEVELDEHSMDTITDLFDDVLRMQEWMDRTASALQTRLGEYGVHQKIAALRAKTVANGCTPDEVTAAQRAADRLERKLAARLVA